MLFAFEATPHSQNYRSDFAKWRQGRDMAHYAPVLPWIKLILDERSPFSLKDVHRGISFLFPMEKLFERYVTQILDTHLGQLGYSVTAQLQTEYLSSAPRAFQLRPDIGVFRGGKLVGILDAKWKLIDKNARYTNGDPDPKLGIKQADVYQLLAYGHKYLKGRGKVTLIYPQWTRFDEPFSFQIGDELTLNVVPFDLVADKCAVL
jgi:5-methylcytosine-specific restriction enzyme subunit McrC